MDLNLIRPSSVFWTTKIDEPVKLQIEKDKQMSFEPYSISCLLKRTTTQFAACPALVYQTEENVWTTITYEQYYQKVMHLAKCFIKLGLEPHRSVAVLAFTCPEWFYSELATIVTGGVITGIYTTNSPEAVYHILQTSNAAIAIVDDNKQMEKVRAVRDRLTNLKVVIQIHGPYEFSDDEEGFMKWTDLEKIDISDVDTELEERFKNAAINECCCIIYTSGTVGLPKAAMLNQDNIIFDVEKIVDRLIDAELGAEVIVSYLPLNHIAAQIFDIFLALRLGAIVYFADKDALRGSLVKTLNVARPTMFFGVPRVFEKFQETMIAKGALSNPVMKAVLRWAEHSILQYHSNLMKGIPTRKNFIAAYIMNKVKTAMGLDRSKCYLTGGAPMARETKEFFASIDMPIAELYGLSECSGCVSMDLRCIPNFETAGRALDDVEVKIEDPNEESFGEICIRGRNNFMGYLGDIEKTKEILKDDGWLHSGDLGCIDEKGFLYITGRLKEIIITAGGENVPPIHIENLIKRELGAISNAFLVGDRRKYLTVLLTFKTKSDPNSGIPQDELLDEAMNWMKSLGVHYETVSQILDAGPCPKVLKSIQEGIDRANKHAICNAFKVQKFAILPRDFSFATGELGPTLKVKRNIVVQQYADVINKLYDEK